MEGGCNFVERKEREKEGLRGRNVEKSDLIEPPNLEQPKVGYPNPPYK